MDKNWGFPGSSAVKNPPAMQELQETWVQSLGREDPLEEGKATHSNTFAWKIPWTQRQVLQPASHEQTGGLIPCHSLKNVVIKCSLE